MKTKSLATFAGSLLFFLFSFNAQAQLDSVKTMSPVTVQTTKLTPKVASAFNSRFQDAVDPIWSKMDRDFLVHFTSDDQPNKALYRKNGYMVYHIAYGDEGKLPEDLRKLIRSNYVDYTITHAIKVEEANRTVWMVNLEDKEGYVVVRCENYFLEEVKQFKKSNL